MKRHYTYITANSEDSLQITFDIDEMLFAKEYIKLDKNIGLMVRFKSGEIIYLDEKLEELVKILND